MPDVPYTSTDRLAGSTDHFTLRVIKRGSLSVDVTTAGSVGFTGSTAVSIPEIVAATFYPVAFVYRLSTGGGINQYIALPWTNVLGDGTVRFSDNFALNSSAAKDGTPMTLSVSCYSSTSVTRTFYYQLCSLEAGQFNPGSTAPEERWDY